MNFNAALLQLINMGEQVAKLDADIRTNYTAIEWQKLKGFRNIAVHDYHHLDAAKVFDIIKTYLPNLIIQLESVVGHGLANNYLSEMELMLSKDSEFYDRVDFSKLI